MLTMFVALISLIFCVPGIGFILIGHPEVGDVMMYISFPIALLAIILPVIMPPG
jgi:hypothetical protein